MTRRYLADLEQENEVVEKGRYTVEVVDARSAETSSGGDMLWLDLKIIARTPSALFAGTYKGDTGGWSR